MRLETIWTSDPMRIGKHEWRVGVAVFSFPKLQIVDGYLKKDGPSRRQRCTFYEWRSLQSHVWNPDKLWPTYDDNRGEDGGMPKTLRKLYAREEARIRELLDESNFATELTPEGEQTVIPGCERNSSNRATQLDLFG